MFYAGQGRLGREAAAGEEIDATSFEMFKKARHDIVRRVQNAVKT
jgi:hypothetical protein